jgi:hypothetical protein
MVLDATCDYGYCVHLFVPYKILATKKGFGIIDNTRNFEHVR